MRERKLCITWDLKKMGNWKKPLQNPQFMEKGMGTGRKNIVWRSVTLQVNSKTLTKILTLEVTGRTLIQGQRLSNRIWMSVFMFEGYLNVEMVRNCIEMCLLQFCYHVWVKLLHVGSVYPKFEVRGDLGKKLRCVAISKSCQMHLWSNVRGGLGDLWWEALAPSTTIRNPKYWTREWKTGWNEVRRCGVSQWVWNANGAPDDGVSP